MKCGVSVALMNSADWDRVLAEDWSRPPVVPDHVIVDGALALGDLVEPLGFDSLWSSEHFGTPYGLVPNSLQFLAYWAGRTERVDLGTLVVVLPWWHPVRVMHEMAMLDLLLKGRHYTIGIGRGLSPKEFGPLGVPQEEARQRFNEIVDIIRLGFSTERFSYDGKIFQIPEMSLRPQPRHKNLTDGAVAAFMTPTSLEAVAKSGLGQIVVTAQSYEKVGQNTALFNKFRQEAGHSPDSQPIIYLHAYCVEKEQDAYPGYDYQLVPDAANHYGFVDPNIFTNIKGYEQYTKMFADRAPDGSRRTADGQIPQAVREQLVGTPDQVIAKVRDLQRLTSAKEIVVVFNYGGMPFEDSERSMRLFAREVLPAIHEMPTPLHDSCRPEALLEGSDLA